MNYMMLLIVFNKMKKILFVFLISALLVQTVFALTATSSSYSVSMLGNSISTGEANSNIYSATFLSESRGTTSNSQSSSFMSNIGFFESGYFTTVSINSYSISPKTAVIGSTIALSINANGAQNVWVEITAPNSQTQTLTLVNGQTLNYLPVPSIVGTYQVVFYANSSNGAIASVVDSFELIQQIIQQPSSTSGSGGGSSGGIQSCTYNWDCTPWSLCSDGKQTRTCVNIGTCIGTESKPVELNSCSQSLFDISLDLNDILVEDDKIRFVVDLEERFGLEEIDIHLKYSIINSDNFEVFSQIETKAILGELSIGKEISLNLPDGDYILRVDVLYGNLQRAFAEQSFTFSRSKSITGFAFIDYINSRKATLSVILLIISLITLLGIYYYMRIPKTHAVSNSLNNIIGLDVYTDNGMKIGKAYDLVIKDNKIYGIIVSIRKGVPVLHGKVMIRYEYVQNIKDVILVSSNILEHHSQSA